MLNEDEYDDEYILLNEYEKKVKTLKEEYDLDDYLNYKETRDILTFEHYNRYVKKVGEKIEKYVSKYIMDNMCDGYLDKGGDKLVGYIMNMVYERIEKEYDLNIFYNCPELATGLVMKRDK